MRVGDQSSGGTTGRGGSWGEVVGNGWVRVVGEDGNAIERGRDGVVVGVRHRVGGISIEEGEV